ncbi:platelet endothelial aggregation receptor 1-like isoform X2 [Saccostrea cucullata]|uniref:platelet endothelial aggregation receptor 1-like isoform X2 n=1 Tax=Saccostrea cuccullata TaxID=36930 RepID=UPI002ECFF4CF
MKIWICIYLCCLKSSTVSCQNLTGDNICFKGNARICCSDYKAIGNICVECDPGLWGPNCSSTCPADHYGRRCQDKCHCSSFQYCDRESGCLCNRTSANCTRTETTVETNLESSSDITTRTNIIISSAISVTALVIWGSAISFWIKKRLRKAKESRQTTGKQLLSHTEEMSSSVPQTHQTRDDLTQDIYAHTTSGIYHHLSLRVQLSSLSDSDNNRENPSHCPGLSPDTISEQSEERIQTEEKESQTDIHTDSENSEEVFFDVSYVGLNSDIVQTDETLRCSLKPDTDVEDDEYCDVKYTGQHSIIVYGNEVLRQQNSSKSEPDVDNDGVADYINCINIFQVNESVGDVYSSVQKTSKRSNCSENF